MRHRNKLKKLGRTSSHRKAMLKNMASALIEHKQIRTTFVKAKALQSYIDRLITFGKKDSVHARREAFKHLQSRTMVKTLFDDVASTLGDRKGGYSRVVRLGKRRGDGAEMAIVQLVGFESLIIDEGPSSKSKKKKKPAKKAAAAAAVAAGAVTETAEEAVEATEKAAEKTVEAVKDAAETVEEAAGEAAEAVEKTAKKAAKVAEETTSPDTDAMKDKEDDEEPADAPVAGDDKAGDTDAEEEKKPK